ncbi:hypothetical protein FXB78_05225 [Aggregatibacter actinomycetemcomitans]|nr:hypothetical protein FXB78_05225 [Aggregatibacter actinomycetemcomitans]
MENQQGVGIYVDDSHVTHGILFPGVNVFKDEAHEVSIFKEKIAVRADPESRATAEEKDRLGPVFKKIWQELDAGKDGSGGEQREARFEAGSLKQLLTNPLTGRRLTGIVVRHKSEWSVGQAGKFEELKALIRKHKCAEEAERLGKRIADLGIRLKGEGFDSEREAYYFHPLGMIGWLSTGCPDHCKTDVIKFRLSNGEYYVVSKESLEFILETEGYEKYPYVPGAKSGVTIGYGYDLGQQTPQQIATDLSTFYGPDEIRLLQRVSGLKAQQAKSALPIVSKIVTSKETALELSAISKARYAQYTFDIWPEAISIHPHCQGALLSIVYNRGNDLKGERRREMRNIQTYLKEGDYKKVPGEIISMKRLWQNDPNVRGLLIRRDKEAEFFKRGMECTCYE